MHCGVYAPSDSVASLRVQWYRSESGQLTGTDAELIDSISAAAAGQVFDQGPVAGLVRLQSNTIVLYNLTSEDSGYYWCQIVVNDTCLQPSPPGLIEFTTTASNNNCNSAPNIRHLLCADITSSCPSSKILNTESKIVSTESTEVLTTKFVTVRSSMGLTCSDANGSFDPDGNCAIVIYSVGSPVVVVVLCCLFVVLPVCLCVRRRRRRRREMEVGTAKPASSDYKIQSAHTE